MNMSIKAISIILSAAILVKKRVRIVGEFASAKAKAHFVSEIVDFMTSE
jgi:hypothetical protein